MVKAFLFKKYIIFWFTQSNYYILDKKIILDQDLVYPELASKNKQCFLSINGIRIPFTSLLKPNATYDKSDLRSLVGAGESFGCKETIRLYWNLLSESGI